MINFYSICTVYITLPIAPKIAEKKEEFVKKKITLLRNFSCSQRNLYVLEIREINHSWICFPQKIIFLPNLTAVGYQNSFILFGFPFFPLKQFFHGHGILNDLSNFKDKVFGAPRHKLKDKRISLGLIIILDTVFGALRLKLTDSDKWPGPKLFGFGWFRRSNVSLRLVSEYFASVSTENVYIWTQTGLYFFPYSWSFRISKQLG